MTTEEYVAYIKFVDQAQQNVDEMESQLDYVKELYDTMEEFAFPIPSMDMANYLVTLSFNQLANSVASTNFCIH